MFRQEGTFVSIVNRIADMVILSVLWCVFSLPLVTVGASSAALYHTVVKVIRQDRGYAFSTFTASFRSNLRQALAPTLLYLSVFGALGAACLVFWEDTDSILASSYVMLSMILLLLFAAAFLHTVALIGRFRLTGRELFTVVVRLSFRHLFRNILLLCMLVFALEAALYYLPLLFILPSGFSFLCSLIQEPLFSRYIRFEDDWNTDVLHREDLPFSGKGADREDNP